jgi:hypothetical protein
MRLRLAERRAHHRRCATDVTGNFPPDQCAHSAETRFYSHVRHPPAQEWIAQALQIVAKTQKVHNCPGTVIGAVPLTPPFRL